MSKKIVYRAVQANTLSDLVAYFAFYSDRNAEVCQIFTPEQTHGERWCALLLIDNQEGDE